MNQSLDAERPAPTRVPNPTLDSLSPSAVAAVRRIPAHQQSVIPCNIARRPASIYTDPAHFELEQRAIFKRFAVPVGVSAQLPEPNMFQAIKAYGLPLLLSRGAKGEVKVFLNACQHRGAVLVERTDAFKGGRVSCPYHAWTYSASGALVGVPRQEVFEGLKKEELSLAELPSKEAGGPDLGDAGPPRPSGLQHRHGRVDRRFQCLEPLEIALVRAQDVRTERQLEACH